MATAPPKISNHLECGICKNQCKRPKMLDCQHNFCEGCLEKYHISSYKGAAQIPCPVCKLDTALSGKHIQGLKTNVHLMGMVEEASHQEDPKVICQICDKEKEGMLRCLDCAQNLCPSCCKIHLRFTAASHHTVATLEEICLGKAPVEKTREKDEPQCHKHKGQVQQLYCETCEELICLDCTAVDHCKPTHHYTDVADASFKYRKSLNEMFSNFNEDIQGIEQCLAASSQAKRQLARETLQNIKAVEATAARIRAEITNQENKLLEEIKQIEEQHNRSLDKQARSLSEMLQGKQHSLETAKDVTNTASDDDFLHLYPLLSKNLESLKGQNPPDIDPSLSYLRFAQGNPISDISLGQLELRAGQWEMCREIGRHGRRLGEFHGARGVTATQPGEIAVADSENKRVVIYSNEGQHMRNIALQSYPRAAAAICSHDSQLVIVDDTKYVKIFQNGKLVRTFTTVPQIEVDQTDVDLQSVAVKMDGTIIVGDVKRMVQTEHRPADGKLLHTVPVQTQPHYLAIDGCTGRVVISGGNQQKVDVADSNGTTLSTVKPTINSQSVQSCRGVCCNSSGIYVAVWNGEFGSGHIHHYDLTGSFLDCLAKDLYSPHGVTFTSNDEQLAVADCHSVKMYRKV
ncbi:uncharacterized protein LOC110973640 [Acanthaster planci]|uniref:Uncharacterized protein LOC110973640 n=1 Tax=Acanthaster planci TaxID=133434 RepID=A0A8B7XK24_ACAPL|nr:uncharacterized protein LOC110973640 [Acanthaster planci]XP_022080306.1 uncharacterized protein LOC110973640 [Acanthaster planci]